MNTTAFAAALLTFAVAVRRSAGRPDRPRLRHLAAQAPGQLELDARER